MRTLLINTLIGIIAIFTITYYSFNSDGGDIIYIFLSIMFFGVHSLFLIFFKSIKNKKWAFIGVLICVTISFIVFYYINKKKKHIEPNVTSVVRSSEISHNKTLRILEQY